MLAELKAGSNHANFLSHPYTCNGQAIAKAVSICNDIYLIDQICSNSRRFRRSGLRGPVSFAGVGGFMLGHISTTPGLAFPFSLILAGLCAVPLGLLIGLPALRLRGVNLAVVTLGAAAVIDALLFNVGALSGGVAGLPMPTPRLFGLNLGIAEGHDYSRGAFGLTALVIVVGLGVLVARLLPTDSVSSPQ